MGPANGSGFVVDGFDGAGKIQEIVATGEAFGFALSSEIKHAVALRCDHVEKTSRRIKAGSEPIGGAIGAGGDERAVASGLFLGIGNGLALGVDAGGPVAVDEWR